jgi:hypothetical protein
MPPKKAKVKVSKSSKSGGGKGVNIKIVIDQSKRTKGQAPKASTGMRQLPAFSAMPQGPSFLGASYPNRQDAPATATSQPLDVTAIGDRVFNQLLAESNRLRQSASGFGGFQNAGQQLNQIFDGQYRAGRNNFPIISNPYESETSRQIDYAVFDDPETNNQILGNKLNNRGSMLPETGENSVVQVNLDEKRDNDLDNLLIHEKKSKATAGVEDTFDEELQEEDERNEDYVLKEIATPRGQEERSKELALESEEAQYTGQNLTSKMKKQIYDIYNLPPIPSKSAKLQDFKNYVNILNDAFGTSYETNFKGKRAQDEFRRVIRLALLREFDELNS